jgi:YnbE-like lipoprotein
MIRARLTDRAAPARIAPMERDGQTRLRSATVLIAGALVVAGAVAAAGCVTVAAPDKPIVIELNINIKQEVVYRLSADAGNTIQSNPGIF